MVNFSFVNGACIGRLTAEEILIIEKGVEVIIALHQIVTIIVALGHCQIFLLYDCT